MESVEQQQLVSLEKDLLRDLNLMKHRQVIHPVLQEGMHTEKSETCIWKMVVFSLTTWFNTLFSRELASLLTERDLLDLPVSIKLNSCNLLVYGELLYPSCSATQ